MFNEVVLIGRLARKPEMKEYDGVKLATIVMDVERPYRNSLGVKEHDLINCILWKGISQAVMDCCDEGSFLGLKGRLQSIPASTSKKNPSMITEVKVEHVEFLDRYFQESSEKSSDHSK
ncbi:MAG: single-stranded DNA-binding protein [Erysipelotrichaceae bacterium]|nr:single-stranded DNA-binding protein [Erysipelotrichaceae bacterium]